MLVSPRRPVAQSVQPHAQGAWPPVEAIVAAVQGVAVDELKAPGRRSARVAFARQCAMYLAHVVLGASYTEIGRRFSRDRTTVAHACRVIEERRENAAFDRLLTSIEDSIRAQSEPDRGRPEAAAGAPR